MKHCLLPNTHKRKHILKPVDTFLYEMGDNIQEFKVTRF